MALIKVFLLLRAFIVNEEQEHSGTYFILSRGQSPIGIRAVRGESSWRAGVADFLLADT